MFFSFNQNKKEPQALKQVLTILAVILIFILLIQFLTSSNNSRFSSNAMASWTSDIDSSILLNLLALENRALHLANEEEAIFTALPNTMFQLATSIRPNDFRSLLGNELPGFSIFDTEILIAGEGTDYTNLPIESTFPLDEVLQEREAVYEQETEEPVPEEEQPAEERTVNNAVFIYNTHNRESFLPHLPDVTNPDLAHHDEVNITLVSNRLKQALADKGIGAIVDETDIIGEVLVDRGWEYWQSYRASREVVTEAFSQNQELQFAFDLHRDGIARDLTTKEINGESYARVMFVIGKDNPDLESNFQLAKSLHDRFEESYPGISRGVWPQGGAGNDGIYNQDLSENLLLLEVGGIGNTLEEAYRTVDAFAEVFSDYYWDAEAVQGN